MIQVNFDPPGPDQIDSPGLNMRQMEDIQILPQGTPA
jgi:hypothetical protein